MVVVVVLVDEGEEGREVTVYSPLCLQELVKLQKEADRLAAEEAILTPKPCKQQCKPLLIFMARPSSWAS